MSEKPLRLLEGIVRKCGAGRSPYVPVSYFKHIPDYKKNLQIPRKRGLIFVYKAGEAVGVSKKGIEALKAQRQSGEVS